jgi:hypothetical protein
VVVYLAVK